MIFLRDADVVLPDRVLSPGTVVIDGDRIVDVLANSSPDELFVEVDEDRPTVLIYTSGTTSVPKGVALTYTNLSVYVTNTMNPADPGEEPEVTLLSVPIFHVAGVTPLISHSMPLLELAVALSLATGVLTPVAAVGAILLNVNFVLSGIGQISLDGPIIVAELLMVLSFRVVGGIGFEPLAKRILGMAIAAIGPVLRRQPAAAGEPERG